MRLSTWIIGLLFLSACGQYPTQLNGTASSNNQQSNSGDGGYNPFEPKTKAGSTTTQATQQQNTTNTSNSTNQTSTITTNPFAK